MNTVATLNPAAFSFTGMTVRRMDMEFPDDIPEFWYADDPFRTLLLASLSAVFPEGERFFIDAVRNFQSRITDPQLQASIRTFIGQEANHSKEHKSLNEYLAKKGYPVNLISKRAHVGMKFLRKYLSPERQLARTAALEHFTAMLSAYLLEHPEEFDSMEPVMAKLWAWHAVEESEHKATAFDVFRTAVNNEWIRRSEMAVVTVEFLFFSSLNFVFLMTKSRRMTDWKMWKTGLGYLWGKEGVIPSLVPYYWDYYRRDFHPWQHDNRMTMAAVKKAFLEETQ